MDRLDDVAKRQVADIHERGIQSNLRAIVIGIEIALRTGIASTVLVVALVRGDERKRWNVARAQIFKQSVTAFKADDVVQAEIGFMSFLHTLEINKGVVLGGI